MVLMSILFRGRCSKLKILSFAQYFFFVLFEYLFLFYASSDNVVQCSGGI